MKTSALSLATSLMVLGTGVVRAGYQDAININFSDGGGGAVSGSLTGVSEYGATTHWNNNNIVGEKGNPGSSATTDGHWVSDTCTTAYGVPVTVIGGTAFVVSFYTGGGLNNGQSQTSTGVCGGAQNTLLAFGLLSQSGGQYSSCNMSWSHVPFHIYDVWWLAGNSGTPGDSSWHLAASCTNVDYGNANVCGQYQSVSVAAIQILSKDYVAIVGGLLLVR